MERQCQTYWALNGAIFWSNKQTWMKKKQTDIPNKSDKTSPWALNGAIFWNNKQTWIKKKQTDIPLIPFI